MAETLFDITALGEVLIDFTPHTAEDGSLMFRRNPGGAPLNMLAQAARLGASCAFIGMAGKDGFGDFLEQTARDAGVDVRGFRRSAAVPTTLAFVHLDADGERSFSFYRKPGADVMLTKDDLDRDLIAGSRIFHFGSLSVTDEPAKSATREAVRIAKENGCIVSYDPNYRPALWASAQEAQSAMCEQIRFADVVKVSEEEMEMITGENDPAEGCRKMLEMGVSFVCVTFGKDGAFFYNGTAGGHVAAFSVQAVDTTGAGDAFWGALLSRIRSYTTEEMQALDKDTLTEIVRYGNAAGALVASSYGAINSVRDDAAIRALMNRYA